MRGFRSIELASFERGGCIVYGMISGISDNRHNGNKSAFVFRSA